jgi:hypothetical protein
MRTSLMQCVGENVVKVLKFVRLKIIDKKLLNCS